MVDLFFWSPCYNMETSFWLCGKDHGRDQGLAGGKGRARGKGDPLLLFPSLNVYRVSAHLPRPADIPRG